MLDAQALAIMLSPSSASSMNLQQQQQDTAVFFLYPDTHALELELRKELECTEEEFTARYFKKLLESIHGTIDPLLKAYFWHDEGIHWNIVQGGGSKGHQMQSSFLHGSVKFGDGMEDEWMLVRLLLAITKANPLLAASVFDADGDFMLIEAAEALPEWLEPEQSRNRIFIFKGALHIIPPKLAEQTPSLPHALNILRKNLNFSKTLAPASIQNIIIKKSHQNQELHRARLRIPCSMAKILAADARLIGPIVSAFYNQKESTPSIMPAVLTGEFVESTVKMTRIQFAQLACREFDYKGAGFDEQSKSNPIAFELGIKLVQGLECLSSASNEEPKYATWEPFGENISVQDRIKMMLDSSVSLSVVVCNEPEDSLDWMRIDDATLTADLSETFNNLNMDEGEEAELLDSWTREYESQSAKVSSMKQELSEMDVLVEKMKNFINSTSEFDGVTVEDEDCSDSEAEDAYSDSEAEGACSDSENDELLLEREIFEAINYDPDLFMKIIEANAHLGASSEEFIDRFKKFQADELAKTPMSSEALKSRKKGLADIDPQRIEEARFCARKVSKEPEDESAESADESVTDEFSSDQSLTQQAEVSSDLEDEASSAASTTSMTFEEYSRAMDFELKEELESSGFTTTTTNEADDKEIPGLLDETEIQIALGKGIIEASAAGRSRSALNSPMETIATSLECKLPRQHGN